MIQEIRNYVSTKLKSIDSLFEVYDQPNTAEGIGVGRYDKLFWLNFSAADIVYSSNFYTASYSVTLDMAIKAGRYPQDAHDEIWCKAIDLVDKLMVREDLETASFDNLQVSTITPSNLDDNDLWTKLTLNMTIERSYSFR